MTARSVRAAPTSATVATWPGCFITARHALGTGGSFMVVTADPLPIAEAPCDHITGLASRPPDTLAAKTALPERNHLLIEDAIGNLTAQGVKNGLRGPADTRTEATPHGGRDHMR